MLETTLLAVFTTGLLGGVHCAGMCGGIVSALGFRATDNTIRFPLASLSSTAGSTTAAFNTTALKPDLSVQRINILLLYNTGRLGTYTFLGAVAGSIGTIGAWMQVAWPLQQTSFLLTNSMLLLIGLYLSGVKRIGSALESLGLVFWRLVQPHAARQLTAQSNLSALLAGSLWGLVPCGMVYAVLVAALVSGSAANGAALMLAFGLGTLPNLLLLGSAGHWLANASKNNAIRKLVGAIIIGFAVLGLLRLDVAAQIPLIKELCVHLP